MEINKNFKLNIHIGTGWKYLTAKQSSILDRIIETLENAETKDKRLTTSAFVRKIGINYNTLSRVLGYLVAGRILRTQQYGRMVLYSFVGGWEYRLKEITQKRKNRSKISESLGY